MAHPRKLSALAGLFALVAVAVASRADDAAYVSPPSFRQDVLPILTRYGCNSGACHGKLAGQNGFKLSLRAYAPEMDYPWLTTDLHSRRIDYAFPDQSLLLLKATGQVPHEGKTRFGKSSWAYAVLREWIAQGAQRTAGSGSIKSVRVVPGEPASVVECRVDVRQNGFLEHSRTHRFIP